MLAVSQALGTTLAVVGGIAGLVLLAGLLAGQFRRGVVQELRDALATAKTEIDIERGRSDRLETELKENREQLGEVEKRLIAIEAENRTLRETLSSGIKLAPEFQHLVEVEFRHHEDRSTKMVRGLMQEQLREIRELAAQPRAADQKED